jgi:DNA-binding response OmpR family regulator
MIDLRKKRILAIEDDPTYIHLLEATLKAKGYELIVEKDGLQVLSAVRRVMPDLIITDLMLPGLDGHKLCRMIKFDKKTAHIPVIMLTARDLDKEVELAKQCGADLFLSKTKPIMELLKMLPRIFEQGIQKPDSENSPV